MQSVYWQQLLKCDDLLLFCFPELILLPLFTDFGDIAPVAVQDLSNVLKQGYLEKKRRGIAAQAITSSKLFIQAIYLFIDHFACSALDHSFFGSEWQKRWCVLNNSIFYYFGSDKGPCEALTQ